MHPIVAFLSLASVAGFAGGCLCLSITLSALLSTPPLDGAQVMQMLLPRMGSVMAPLLGTATLCAVWSAWLALRGALGHGPSWLTAAAAFAGIALVTICVHLPLNAQLIGGQGLTPARAGELLRDWLAFHHVRTALALLALGVLLWPLRHSLSHA
jgi:uncharacterized membrane protein